MVLPKTSTVRVEAMEDRRLFAVTVPLESFHAIDITTATNGEQTVIARSGVRNAQGLQESRVFVHLFDQDGQQVRRIIVGRGLGGDDDAPAVAMARDGSFVVVWKHAQDLLAQKFDVNGDATTDVIRVADDPSFDRQPAVAMNNAGEFVVPFVRRQSRSQNVFVNMYAASGTLRHEVTIARTARHESQPDVAMNRGQRGFDIAYVLADTTESNSDTDVVLARYDGNGVLREEGRRKAAATGIKESLPSIAISPNGEEAIVGWIRGDPNGDEFQAVARRYSRTTMAAKFRIGESSEHLPVDVAIFNTGEAISNFAGFVREDPDNFAGLENRIRIRAFETVSVSVASNRTYVAAASDGSVGSGAVDHRGYFFFGELVSL